MVLKAYPLPFLPSQRDNHSPHHLLFKYFFLVIISSFIKKILIHISLDLSNFGHYVLTFYIQGEDLVHACTHARTCLHMPTSTPSPLAFSPSQFWLHHWVAFASDYKSSDYYSLLSPVQSSFLTYLLSFLFNGYYFFSK